MYKLLQTHTIINVSVLFVDLNNRFSKDFRMIIDVLETPNLWYLQKHQEHYFCSSSKEKHFTITKDAASFFS